MVIRWHANERMNIEFMICCCNPYIHNYVDGFDLIEYRVRYFVM